MMAKKNNCRLSLSSTISPLLLSFSFYLTIYDLYDLTVVILMWTCVLCTIVQWTMYMASTLIGIYASKNPLQPVDILFTVFNVYSALVHIPPPVPLFSFRRIVYLLCVFSLFIFTVYSCIEIKSIPSKWFSSSFHCFSRIWKSADSNS